jgi:hypothetical protein
MTIDDQRFDPIEPLRVLNARRVRYVLIGGLAASIRGSPVITGDLDICYARDLENLERLAQALGDLGAELRGVREKVPFQLDARSLQNGDHFTFQTPGCAVDILGAPAGTSGYDDLNAAATDADIAGLTVRVASLDDLMRMKRASGRAKDLIHLEWLGAVRDELERAEAGGEDPAAGDPATESDRRRSPPRL